MSRIAAFAIAAAFIGTPAFAQGGSTDATDSSLGLVINAQVAPRCEVSANGSSAYISDDLSDTQGFARGNVGQLVAAKLNTLGVRASCTGTANRLTLTRTAMVLADSDGSASANGFNRAIIYDIAVSVPGVVTGSTSGNGNGNGNNNGGNTQTGGNGNGNNGCGNGNGGPNGSKPGCGGGVTTGTFTDATTDGAVGVTLGAFTNSQLTFADVDGSRSEAVVSAAAADGPRDTFSRGDARLAAGQYVGTVVLTLSPGS